MIRKVDTGIWLITAGAKVPAGKRQVVRGKVGRGRPQGVLNVMPRHVVLGNALLR